SFFNQANSKTGYVDADPLAFQLFCRVDGGSASAERVKHNVAGAAAGRDDAIQQCERLLRRVAESLNRRRLDRWNICPHVADYRALRFVKVESAGASLVEVG